MPEQVVHHYYETPPPQSNLSTGDVVGIVLLILFAPIIIILSIMFLPFLLLLAIPILIIAGIWLLISWSYKAASNNSGDNIQMEEIK